uniref:glutathione transferase n=1 Tax=Oryza meridionalis TaxID=40149 RepID=A0A0E0EUH8_9ORYZ
MAGLGTGAHIVKVYHEKSMILPDVSRVLACLYEKDVKFEPCTTSYKSLLRLQASTHAPVPFYDGPTFLEESREICRYIAETYEHHGYPFLLGKDALERASIEQWLHHEEHAFNPPSRALFCHLAFPLDQEDDLEMQKAKLDEVLEVYEQRLSDSEFLAGNKFTLADLVHLPNSHYIKASGKFAYLYDSRKNVQRWWNAISTRHSWDQVLSYMTKVEQDNKLEELEKQKQQEWQREYHTATGRRTRLYSRKHTRTKSQTILVPPPDTVSASPMAPQGEQPPSADSLSEKAPVFSSQSTTHKSIASPSKKTTSSTPSLGSFPSTADKPPRIHADMSSIRDVSVPPDTTETEHPTRSMLSSSKEVGTYIEPTPQKPPASLDNFSESDGPISGASHSQISPRTAKEDSDRLHASDLYRSDRKSTGVYSEEKESMSYTAHSYEATYGKSPTRGATDSSPNKLHSTEAHQMLQAEKWHAVQAGLRNLQGDIDNSVPSRQVKPSKDVQQYPSQDSEQVSIRPVAQEPLSMDGQLVQGPEGTAQTPHTDQTMGVSPHWQHAADARRISEDEASSDRRIKGAHWSKHAADEDAQAIPFQTAHDDSQDTTQRARETDSVTRRTRDQDAHDRRQGIMTYDSAPSRLQPMDASHDAPLPSKKSTSQTPYTAAHIPTGYQGAQEFIQQGRERPKPRSVVPYDAQGSTEEEKMAESPPSKAQILGSRGLDVSPPKEVLNEDGYDATGPLQTRYGDDQDDWIQARDSTTPRHMNQDAIEETEMADSEPSKARTLDSQQAFPQKQPPAEDLRFAASTSNRRYFDDQDSTKKSKHTASIPRRMEAQGSLEETKAGESGLPREQPFLQASAKDARSLTPPSQEGYAGPQAVSKQRGDPGSISRRIRAQDARVTFVESKADDSTFTREQPSDAWQATGPLPEHKVYDAQSSTSPFQDATMKSEDTTPQQRRGQGAKETKLSDSASLQVQPLDYQRSDSHLQNQEEIEDPRGAISPHKRSYTDVEDMTKHPGDKILGEDAQDVSEETKALDSTIFRGRAHPQDTHQAAIPPRRQAATKDALGVTPHFPTRYPTAEDTSRQLRRTASTPTEKAVQDGRDAFREWKSVDSTSSREQPSDVQRAEASFPKQEEADSHSTTVPFQRRYPDIEDTTKEPIYKPKEMVGEDAQAGFEETKALDAATQPRDIPRAAITPTKQVTAKDALSVTPLPPTRYPTAEDTSRQPKRTGSTPTDKAVQDGRDAFRESKSVDSTSSTQQPSGYRQAAASLPKQEAADSRSTPLPFQRRYPDVEHTTKEPRDKPKESVGEDAQDGFEETKALDSAIIRGRAQPQETPRAAITPSKQEAAKDALSGTPLSPTRYQTAEETVGEDSQDGFEETKALDSAIFRGRAQPQDTRRSAITPPKLEEAKDALGATPHPPTRYPTSEDTSRQPTRTASTPIEKAVPDGRDAFGELKIVDSTSSREQPSDVRRAAASLRKQEAADSHSTTVPFQRRYTDIEDTTKEPRDKPKEKVSEEAQDGFEETKALDSSIYRGRAQSQDTQRAAITPPKLDAAKDAPGATPLAPTRYPTGEYTNRQPRRTVSTPTEKAVHDGRDDFTESKSVDSTPSREQPSDVRRAAASLRKQEAADSRSTPLPFQRRYPDVEHTTKEPRDKPKESVGEDAQDGFEETKALDSSMFRGRGQLQDTRRSAITPSKHEDVKDALGATPLPPRRYPTAEDTSRQPTRTASTPIEKAVPDGRDAIRELKSVDSTSSREQPSDVQRAPASLPKQEAADSYSTTVPFQRRYPDIEDATKEPRDKPKQKASEEDQNGFEETKALDSSIFRGRAQIQDTQQAAITPSKLDAANDAPVATPLPPTRWQPRRTASTPTEKAVRYGRDALTESKSSDSTPSREQPSDVRRAAASLPKQEAADSRSTPLPFQRKYPDTRDTTKESREKLKEAVGEDGQDGFEETKALDSAIIGGRAQPQETPRAVVTPSKLEGAKDALGVTPIAPTRYPTAEDTSKQSTRTASTPSEKAVPYGRDAFIESKSVDSTSSREQPSDVRRAAASLPKQEAADSRSTTMPFQRRYRDIEDTTKEPRDKPKETVGQDVQDTYEERVTTDSVLFTKQPSDMPRAAITPSKKAATEDVPSVSPPLPTRYPSAEDTSKQSIRPQDSRDVFREQKAVDSTSSPGPSDSLRASASLPNQEVDGTRKTTVPIQKREPELQNSTKPVKDSISTSWEMTAQDTQDTFEETKAPDSAAFSMPEVDSQRTDAEAQAEAQDTRDGGSRSRWWRASKTLPDGTPISGDDVTGLSTGDQMPTRVDQDAIPSAQIANGITEISIKQTAEPPAPVASQTIFHQQARPSAPITKEVQASDNQGAISKIQQVSPDNHPTDYSAVPRVAAQEQVSHAPQTSPGREGITPAQREMDSPISDALPASAKVQEPAPDESTMPFVSSVKQGSHVGRNVEPHEGPLPDTYGAVVDKETTKSLSWQERSLEASPDSTPTHGYVHPTSRDEPTILPGQGAPQEPTHPGALDSASTRDVTADSLVGPKKFKQRSTEDISFASNQTSGMGAQPYSSLDKVARAEQKSDLSDQDPSHSAQETVLAAAERTKALPKPIDQQETPDSRKPPTPDTQYASQIIPSQEKVAPDVPRQEKVSQAELSLKPHEGSTPHMHGSIVDEKKTRPLASPTKSSNDVLDLTPAGADVHPTSSTEPPRSALPVQEAQTPSATQTPPPFASHKSVRTEDIRADANGKVKSVKPSASPDAPHATAPGEVALSEQKLASAGRDSSRAAQLPSSDEPRNEQIKDSDHTAQPFSSAAPDQAKDLQRTFGQPDISRAPGTSESPYSDVYDGARKVDPDYQLIDKTIPSQEQVSHPDLASKTNEGPTETPGPAPLMDVYDSISTQYIQDGDLDKGRSSSTDREAKMPRMRSASALHDQYDSTPDNIESAKQKITLKDQDSANFAQKYSSSEPKEEEITVAAPDQTKEIQTTVGQQDILPAVSKEKDPSFGVQYDSMEVQEVAPKDQHIDGSIPSHEQAPNVEEPMTHITGPSALDTQHDQGSYQYPELPSSAKSRKETDVAEADKTKAKQMTFGQPAPVPSEATRSVTDQGAQQPQRPAKIESPPFLETMKNYEYTQNVSDETLDKNKSSGKPSADQEVMSPKVVPATSLDPQRVTVPDDEQKIAKPDLTRSVQPPFSAEPTKENTVVDASDQAKASEIIVDREGQEHGSFSEGSTTDSRDAITDDSATTSTSGHEKGFDASVLTAAHDIAHPPTVRNLPEHKTQPPASTQSSSVEASGRAKSTDQEDMEPMTSQASILDTQRGTNGDKLARSLHNQGAESPELTHAQQPPESPPHSASQHDVPTNVLDKTKMTKPTSTNQEGMAPTAGPRSTLESQPDGTLASEVVYDEQKSTLSVPPVPTKEKVPHAPQTSPDHEGIIPARGEMDSPIPNAQLAPDAPQGMVDPVQPSSGATPEDTQRSPVMESTQVSEEGIDQQSPQDSKEQAEESGERSTGTGETYQPAVESTQDGKERGGETEQRDTRAGEAYQEAPAPDAPQDKGSTRPTQLPPPAESSQRESRIATEGPAVLPQPSAAQESTPSPAGPRESSSSDSPYSSVESQGSAPKEVESPRPTTGMVDPVQPSSGATPEDTQRSPVMESTQVSEEGIDQQSPQDSKEQAEESGERSTGTGMVDPVQPSSGATPEDTQRSPVMESTQVSEEGIDQQSPQDSKEQAEESGERSTGTGETYQPAVESTQDGKERGGETEQRDTRAGDTKPGDTGDNPSR